MISSSLPFNRCPEILIPVILDILSANSSDEGSDFRSATGSKQPCLAADGYHEKTIVLNGSTYDEMTVFYYHTFGSPFSCLDPRDGSAYNAAFVEKPAVLHHTDAGEPRRYTVCIKLMKLPTPAGSSKPP